MTDGIVGTCSTPISAAIPNCELYATATTCETCAWSFGLKSDGTACTSCGANCAECSDETGTSCTKCVTEAEAPSSGACSNAVEGTNCAMSVIDSASATHCTRCADGYHQSATLGTCALDTTDDGGLCDWSCGDLTAPAGYKCTAKDSPTACSSCELPGTFLNGSTCSGCIDYCLECTDATHDGCTKFEFGHYAEYIVGKSLMFPDVNLYRWRLVYT